jgi:hypothetical protein
MLTIWLQKINCAELHVLNQISKVQLAGLSVRGNTKFGFASCENYKGHLYFVPGETDYIE